MTLLQAFMLFAMTSLLTFGGGYAMIPLLSQQLVPETLSVSEMADVIAIAQITPGAVGLNTATYIGMVLYGIVGACICTAGLVVPTMLTAGIAICLKEQFKRSAIYKGCLYGIRPLVIGLIAQVVVLFGQQSFMTAERGVCWAGIAIFVLTLIVSITGKVNSILLLLIGGALGCLLGGI